MWRCISARHPLKLHVWASRDICECDYMKKMKYLCEKVTSHIKNDRVKINCSNHTWKRTRGWHPQYESCVRNNIWKEMKPVKRNDERIVQKSHMRKESCACMYTDTFSMSSMTSLPVPCSCTKKRKAYACYRFNPIYTQHWQMPHKSTLAMITY